MNNIKNGYNVNSKMNEPSHEDQNNAQSSNASNNSPKTKRGNDDEHNHEDQNNAQSVNSNNNSQR